MNGAQRRAFFTQRRGLQRDVARSLKMSEWHISGVIDGTRPGGPRVKAEIARRMKLPVDTVFPPEEWPTSKRMEA